MNLEKQVYNCFACDAGGNALDFVAHMEGLDPANTSELRKARHDERRYCSHATAFLAGSVNNIKGIPLGFLFLIVEIVLGH